MRSGVQLKRTISDRMSAALDASGRLNRGQHQTIEDIREVLRIEIESRKCEQRDIRNGIESLARCAEKKKTDCVNGF